MSGDIIVWTPILPATTILELEEQYVLWHCIKCTARLRWLHKLMPCPPCPHGSVPKQQFHGEIAASAADSSLHAVAWHNWDLFNSCRHRQGGGDRSCIAVFWELPPPAGWKVPRGFHWSTLHVTCLCCFYSSSIWGRVHWEAPSIWKVPWALKLYLTCL